MTWPIDVYKRQALPITQVKVASSGETVVEVKYDRNSYLLTWNTDGGSYIEPQMLKYGAAVSAPADPTKVGYTCLLYTSRCV